MPLRNPGMLFAKGQEEAFSETNRMQLIQEYLTINNVDDPALESMIAEAKSGEPLTPKLSSGL